MHTLAQLAHRFGKTEDEIATTLAAGGFDSRFVGSTAFAWLTEHFTKIQTPVSSAVAKAKLVPAPAADGTWKMNHAK